MMPDLKIGSRGPDVGNWQRFLAAQHVLDADGHEIVVDEAFGPRCDLATKVWQVSQGLLASGVVRMVERNYASSTTMAGAYIPFIPAKNFTLASRAGTDVSCVIIHDMEYPERPDGAEWCANFFAGVNAPKASAHFCVDRTHVFQCVRERDVAWHAPGANKNGIGIEHAGYAKQSREEWLDDYSRDELMTSASLVAKLCSRWSIPIVRLSPDDLKAGARGISGHIDVTNAFSGGKGHVDPGPNFVWDLYLQWVKEASGGP